MNKKHALFGGGFEIIVIILESKELEMSTDTDDLYAFFELGDFPRKYTNPYQYLLFYFY